MNDDQIDLAHGYALGILEADEQRAVVQLEGGEQLGGDRGRLEMDGGHHHGPGQTPPPRFVNTCDQRISHTGRPSRMA